MAHTNQPHSGFDLIDGQAIDLEQALGTSDTYTGITCYGQAGEILAQWDVCYMGADGLFYKADASDDTEMPAVAITVQALSADAYGIFLLYGFVRDDDWDAWTIGGLLYPFDDTPGLMTQTLVADAGDQVQIVGIAFQTKIILFNPSYELVEIS